MQPMTQRPVNLAWPYLNPNNPLYQGLVFAGLGPHPGGYTYHDCSPYGNHGTLTNMNPATDWVWVPSLNRFGLNGNGTTQYAGVAKAGLATKPMSFSCWFNTSTTPTSYDCIAGNANGPWTQGWQIYFFSNALRFGVEGYSANYAECSYTADATMRHLLATWDGTTIRIYLDGVLGGTTDTYTGSVTDLSDLRLLSSNGGAARNWPGIIVDPIFWNRVVGDAELAILKNPSDVMLSGLILPPRRRLWAVSGAPPAAKYWLWARQQNSQVIGGGAL